MKIDGRCHCGYVSFEADADPETTTICNCTDCQTMSGAPFRAVVITQPGTFVVLSGKPTEYGRPPIADRSDRRDFVRVVGPRSIQRRILENRRLMPFGLEH